MLLSRLHQELCHTNTDRRTDHSDPDSGPDSSGLTICTITWQAAGWLCPEGSACFELELEALDTSISNCALGARFFVVGVTSTYRFILQ